MVPVTVGGWSGHSSGALTVSMLTEVDYRKDEGAPYDDSKYGSDMPIHQPTPTPPKQEPPIVSHEPVTSNADAENEEEGKEDKEVAVIKRKPPEATGEAEVAVPTPALEVAEQPVTVKTKAKGEKKTPAKKVAAPKPVPVTPPSVEPVQPAEPNNEAAPEETGGKEAQEVATKKATKARTKKATGAAKKGRPPRGGTVATRAALAKGAKKGGRAVPAEVTQAIADGFPYTLEQVAQQTGVQPLTINAYRRQGKLGVRGSFRKAGRAVMYSDKGVKAVKAAAAGSTKKGAAARKALRTKAPAKLAAAGVGAGAGVGGALGEAVRAEIERIGEQIKALTARAEKLEAFLSE